MRKPDLSEEETSRDMLEQHRERAIFYIRRILINFLSRSIR